MPFDPSTFGRRLATIRQTLGLTQLQLGTKCGVTQATVHYWEAGRATPGLMRLGLVADALNMTVAELLADLPNNGNDEAAA